MGAKALSLGQTGVVLFETLLLFLSVIVPLLIFQTWLVGEWRERLETLQRERLRYDGGKRWTE